MKLKRAIIAYILMVVCGLAAVGETVFESRTAKGKSYYQKGDYQTAIKYFEAAKHCADKYDNWERICNNWITNCKNRMSEKSTKKQTTTASEVTNPVNPAKQTDTVTKTYYKECGGVRTRIEQSEATSIKGPCDQPTYIICETIRNGKKSSDILKKFVYNYVLTVNDKVQERSRYYDSEEAAKSAALHCYEKRAKGNDKDLCDIAWYAADKGGVAKRGGKSNSADHQRYMEHANKTKTEAQAREAQAREEETRCAQEIKDVMQTPATNHYNLLDQICELDRIYRTYSSESSTSQVAAFCQTEVNQCRQKLAEQLNVNSTWRAKLKSMVKKNFDKVKDYNNAVADYQKEKDTMFAEVFGRRPSMV